MLFAVPPNIMLKTKNHFEVFNIGRKGSINKCRVCLFSIVFGWRLLPSLFINNVRVECHGLYYDYYHTLCFRKACKRSLAFDTTYWKKSLYSFMLIPLSILLSIFWYHLKSKATFELINIDTLITFRYIEYAIYVMKYNGLFINCSLFYSSGE